MPPRDPSGFYAALRVAPTSGQTEIRLAYKMMKRAYRDGKKVSNVGKIKQAYETLSDPTLRAKYDNAAAGASGRRRRGVSSALHSLPLLAGLAALFLIALTLAFGPGVKARFTSFDVGETLSWKKTKQPLGEVLEYKAHHQFDTGSALPAYKVLLGSGEAQWFTATDLHRNCAPR